MTPLDGQSIPAQLRRLREYAVKKNLTIEHTFQITESSTKQTRKEFEKIITLIKKSKHPLVLVADTVDRVQRSFKESAVLDDLRRDGKVEIHFFRENLTIKKDSNSSDILRWDMGVMFAKSYVLQLSDNVKRSKEECLKKGICLGLAPLGYIHTIDAKGDKTVVPDPERRFFITQMFELFATGNYSLESLSKKLNEMGLRTRKGRKVAKSQVESMLKNSFYYGLMKTAKGDFEHVYERLTTETLFNQVQSVFASYHKKPFKPVTTPFILKGMITCSNCGCLITPEIKKKQYIYYSCSNAKGICKRVYVREEVLMDTIQSYFGKIQLPQETIDEITEYLRSIYSAESEYHKQQMTSLRKEQDRIQTRISRMYDDKLDGVIDEVLFKKKLDEYKARQQELIEEMSKHEKADQAFHITANHVMHLAKKAWDLFRSSEVDEKRQLLNFVFQNLHLEGKKLVVTLAEPFNLFVEVNNCPKGWGWLDSNQRRRKSTELQSVAIGRYATPPVKDADSRT